MQIKEYVFEIMLKSYPLKDKIILYRWIKIFIYLPYKCLNFLVNKAVLVDPKTDQESKHPYA